MSSHSIVVGKIWKLRTASIAGYDLFVVVVELADPENEVLNVAPLILAEKAGPEDLILPTCLPDSQLALSFELEFSILGDTLCGIGSVVGVVSEAAMDKILLARRLRDQLHDFDWGEPYSSEECRYHEEMLEQIGHLQRLIWDIIS